MINTLSSLHSLSGKTAILRLDTDVDIKNGKILDDTRLDAGMHSLNSLLQKGANVNIIGHLGRPGLPNSKLKAQNSKLSLEPVAKWFADKLSAKGGWASGPKPFKIGSFEGWEITNKVNLVENIRFFKEEEDNDPEFAREISMLGDIYVNDAFAVSHREHASIVGIPKHLLSYAGVHLEKEIEVLSSILKQPPPGQRPSRPAAKRPLAIVIGGAKIETKLPLVEKMHQIADFVLVGGEIAEKSRVLLKVQHEKIEGRKSAVIISEPNYDGTDISEPSVENFKQILGMAATIVWNGPVGLINLSDRIDSERGTREIAEFIVKQKAYKVVGGGDTLSYLNQLKLLDKFDFVSTGGGAMLEFLSGHKLPGIEALEK